MSRVSLDPVANVLKSTVQNVVAVLVSEQVAVLALLALEVADECAVVEAGRRVKVDDVGRPACRVEQGLPVLRGRRIRGVRIVLGNTRGVAVELELLIVDRQGGSGGDHQSGDNG